MSNMHYSRKKRDQKAAGQNGSHQVENQAKGECENVVHITVKNQGKWRTITDFGRKITACGCHQVTATQKNAKKVQKNAFCSSFAGKTPVFVFVFVFVIASSSEDGSADWARRAGHENT